VSDPIDIKALDEYLKGGSDISQRYRELGGDDVPPELDRRVLNEARAAVAGGGAARSRSWLRWSAPVALAASVVLVVAVVIESPVQDAAIAIRPASEEGRALEHAEDFKLREETAQARQEPEVQMHVPEQPSAVAPAAAPSAPPPPSVANLSKAERKRASNAPVEEVQVTAQAREQSLADAPIPISVVTEESTVARNVDRPASVAADSSAKADGSTEIQEAIVTGARQRRAAGRTAGPRNTISGSAFRTETRPTADADAEQAEPEKWLEEIRDLRREGKTAEADRAWERFLEEYPNFPVAEDDLARKKR
jgi:hypothetical protein